MCMFGVVGLACSHEVARNLEVAHARGLAAVGRGPTTTPSPQTCRCSDTVTNFNVLSEPQLLLPGNDATCVLY